MAFLFVKFIYHLYLYIMNSINPHKLRAAILNVRALAHRARLAIVSSIDQGHVNCPDDIEELLSIEQSEASRHVRILRDRGIVISTKEGKHMRYSLDYDVLTRINNAVTKLVHDNKRNS